MKVHESEDSRGELGHIAGMTDDYLRGGEGHCSSEQIRNGKRKSGKDLKRTCSSSNKYKRNRAAAVSSSSSSSSSYLSYSSETESYSDLFLYSDNTISKPKIPKEISLRVT